MLFDYSIGERERWWGLSVRPVVVEAPVIANICPNDNHPHMIDLGLPSGTKWACCNVDPTPSNQSPTNFGGYYSWGELEVKDSYGIDDYEYSEGGEITPIFTFLGEDISGTEYDVAHMKWGGSWQMPSNIQIQELLSNCSYSWISLNGVNGALFTGSNNAKIFLPAAGNNTCYGLADMEELAGVGEYGCYWSSIDIYSFSNPGEFSTVDTFRASLSFSVDGAEEDSMAPFAGYSVRPVSTAATVSHLQLSFTGVHEPIMCDEEFTVEILSGSGSYTVTSNDPNAEFVSVHLDGNMIYIHGVGSGEAVITVTDTQTGETATIEVTVTAPVIVNICPDDNHPHIIDLGLPSGTKWACCNVDTDNPENQSPTSYGGHYAWGETGVKSEYTVYSYAHFDIDEDNFTYIGDHIGNTEYDVAHVAWKGSWQMPTDEECDELMDCVQEETTINGVKGLKIIGPNDNFIFLPYAGYRYETELTNQGSSGWYWTETYNEGQWSKALGIPMSFVDVEPREIGHSVRPVIAVNVSTISVTSAGMATYCSPYDLDFRNVTNLKAYIITGYDWQSRRVYATRVYDVPAGLGIYLVGDEGIYDVPRGTSTSYYVANMLVGTLTETIINPTDGDLTNLRLTGSSPKDASFKTFTQPRTFSANRAYLQIPTAILNTSANAVDIVFDDEVDGIDGISQNAENTDNNWFTLDGRKLSGKPSTKGVYVVNGRKVVVK